MTVAYFDCTSGISGDMFLGALVDAGLAVEKLSAAVESLGIDGLHLEAEKVTRLGIAATKVHVIAPREDVHRHLSDIEKIISASTLSDSVKKKALGIFARVAEAEAKVHGEPVEKVHFHEVGALDSIADIVGAAAGLELLGVTECVCSAVATGSGTVPTAHGVLPVPAPATAEILVGVPLAASEETGELATPTGAALVRELADGFGLMPAMTLTAVGNGAGTRQGKRTPNVLRVFLGEACEDASPGEIFVVEATVDDMTGEAVAFAAEALFAAGALDVFVTPVFMKKGRPGHLVTVLAAPDKKAAVIETLFRETTTFGARARRTGREVLERETVEVESDLGAFRVKTGRFRGKLMSATPEYEDARRIALAEGLPLRHVYERLEAAARDFLESKGMRLGSDR